MENPETTIGANEIKTATPGYGFWCFDCGAPMLAESYDIACANAFTAGWKIIRGVHRCAKCADLDERGWA